MFGTLSFSESGRSNTFKDHSFAHYGSGHSARRFACEICRAHKIKCSGDKSGCARCISLKIKCVYDNVSKSRSQPLPRKEKDAVDNAVDDEPSFTEFSLTSSTSPELHTAGSSSDVQTTMLTRTPGPLLCDDSGASMDLMNDDTTLGDLDDTLDWALMNDDCAPTPDLISSNSAFDPRSPLSQTLRPTSTTQLQALSMFRSSKSSSPHQASSTFSSNSPPRPCTCSARLSNSLFSLNGHLRRHSSSYSPTSPGCSTISLDQSISSILTSHASAVRLGDDMAACASRCLAQASNAVQLVMLIEQLVDLYAALVEQLSAARYAVDGTTDAEMAMAVPVQVGAYMIESAAEREAMIMLLVGGRIKALTRFVVTCRERLGSASGAGECRGRLNAAVQRLGDAERRTG